jgi:muconolactone delta-isomerase
MYKVAAQRRVIAIVEVESADELDRNYMARLPLREYLELEVVWCSAALNRFWQIVRRKCPKVYVD